MTPPVATPFRFETPRLVLRELEESDWPAARAWDGDPEVVRYMSYEARDEEGTREALRRNIAAAREEPRRVFDFAITRRGDPTALGRVGLKVERPEHRDAMIWFVIRRDLWGQGLVTEAMRPVISFAFAALGLHRLWGDADPRNPGSVRVMEKLGMRREAHLVENWWLKGEWCDSYLYALLDREWKG
jgi:[ribosomal protein S5]-alanine N-acetyltransferase